jgi:hypothetical protein
MTNATVADSVMDFSDSGSRSLLPSDLYHQVGKTRLIVYQGTTAIDRLSALYSYLIATVSYIWILPIIPAFPCAKSI